MKKKNSTTASERVVALTAFKSIEQKVRSSSDFTPDEKKVVKIIAQIVSRMADGWKKAGTKRDEKPSKSALYFRWLRARKALVQSTGNQPESLLIKMRQEVEKSELEYREFKEENVAQ